ncbi:hypothetical protein [Microbulbifer sp. Q7]|uniref:hypothetical protein n=1 Tax=Microbulbifer sp. Q7 TaxID=1785091 RepID=UPI0008336A4C|nr:hypothetical protein [Microbulbifer sp. Q7]
MNKISKLLSLGAVLIFFYISSNASAAISINSTGKSALLDGRCGNDEWDVATKLELPAQVAIYLMKDDNYFYICARAKEEDITVLDLYIENPETNRLHKFHLSAQMGEKVLTENGWERVSGKWDLKNYAGFWVPFSGLEEPENRKGPIWAKGTHRQVQVSRNKFPGNIWNMMFGISAIYQEGERAEFLYPKNAVSTDPTSWAQFSFSE